MGTSTRGSDSNTETGHYVEHAPDYVETTYSPGQRARPKSRNSDDDDTLLTFVRRGDTEAFAELYLRHRADALRYATRLTKRLRTELSADDVVAEAVRKVLAALRVGRGPRDGFRLYLFTATRNVAVSHAIRPHRPGDEVLSDAAARDASGERDDALDVIAALASLPQHWQQVLWATEALDLTPTEVASRFDASPRAVAMMAMRAREALRIAYVRVHLPQPPDRACRRALELLAKSAVVALSATQTTFLDLHVASCSACHDAELLVDGLLDEWTRAAGDAAVADAFRARTDDRGATRAS